MKKNKKELPVCVGIIMDGNRRWAKQHKLPVFAGHNAGYKKLKEVVLWGKEEGIKTIIVYAFSTENWNRSEKEVNALMKLFEGMLIEKEDFRKNDVKVTFIGQKDRFRDSIKQGISVWEHETKNCKAVNLVVAISYGGRAEVLNAVNNLLSSKKSSVSEEEFSKNLWTAGIVDPDIVIRTGGEKRLSNFLPWQSVYSELFFVDTFWPAFTKKEFKYIIDEYKKREKREGK